MLVLAKAYESGIKPATPQLMSLVGWLNGEKQTDDFSKQNAIPLRVYNRQQLTGSLQVIATANIFGYRTKRNVAQVDWAERTAIPAAGKEM